MVTRTSVAPKTIGGLIDELKKIDTRRAVLAAEEKALKADRDLVEKDIIALMDKQDTRTGEGKLARASIIESEEPTVENWDTFLMWARRTNNLHLVQRRISAPAWREIRALKKTETPGIGVFKKRSLSLRAV